MNFINEVGNNTDHRSKNLDSVNESNILPINYIKGLQLDYDESSLYYLSSLRQSPQYYDDDKSFINNGSVNSRLFILKPFYVGTNTWSIEVSFKYNTPVGAVVYMHYNGTSYWPIRLLINSTGYLQLALTSSTTSFNIANFVNGVNFIGTNQKVWTRLSFTGTQYLLDISYDGINYINDITITSTTNVYSSASYLYSFSLSVIGSGSNLRGNIYNEDVKIKIGDEYLVNGIYLHKIKVSEGNARGYLNKYNLIIDNNTYKDVSINISNDKNKGSFITYNNHNILESQSDYGIFIVGNGIDNNIICIHNSAHSNGILNSDAIAAIKNQLIWNNLDYRYLGDVKTNHYFIPYLERYVKRLDGVENNITSSIDNTGYDSLSGYETNVLGIKKSWTRVFGGTYASPPFGTYNFYIDNYE